MFQSFQLEQRKAFSVAGIRGEFIGLLLLLFYTSYLHLSIAFLLNTHEREVTNKLFFCKLEEKASSSSTTKKLYCFI